MALPLVVRSGANAHTLEPASICVSCSALESRAQIDSAEETFCAAKKRCTVASLWLLIPRACMSYPVYCGSTQSANSAEFNSM